MDETKNNTAWKREVGLTDVGTRLDKFWARELKDEGVSRGRIKQWIEDGMAIVEGDIVTKGKHKLLGYETVTIGESEGDSTNDVPEPVAGELDIVYEDEHVIVIDKAAGVTTHPAPGEPGPTLVNLLLHKYPDIVSDASGMGGQRPGIVHRLDKDTSGLIATVRTEADRLKLSADFAGREIRKVYLAIVHGCPARKEGVIEAPIGRHPSQKTKMAVVAKGGREAVSDYTVLWTGPRNLASLVAVRIHTGRTHQIRVHMAHIGHPLVGDVVYGSRENAEWVQREDRLAALAPRQMLHAFTLSFVHPNTGERMALWRKPPADFQALLEGLKRECLRVGIVGMPGSGKSSVVESLRAAKAPTFSADEVVAELYAAGGDGAAMVRQRFGGIYSHEDGSVNKAVLFGAMRESEGIRREIMDMIHPMVQHRCEEFFAAHRDVPATYAEIPLLLEGGWHENGSIDVVAGVHCPSDKRTGELRQLRQLDEETLAVFDSWQWPEKDKLAACDLVLENCAGLEALKLESERLQRWAKEQFNARNEKFKRWLDELWPRLAERFGEGEE